MFIFCILVATTVGCGDSSTDEPRSSPDIPQSSAPTPDGFVEASEAARLQLAELQRVRMEHAALFTAVPTVTSVPSTLTAAERQEAAVARVLEWPAGYPVPPPADSSWFDPELGLSFLRLEGGDWTSRRMRRSHPHRELFFFEDYPEGVPNFADGSLQRDIGLELAFRAFELYPFLGEPTSDVVDLFASRMGWEIRDAAGPVVNVWTVYDLYADGQVQRFGVGGVAALRVSRLPRGGDDFIDHLSFGAWVGPVVVERIR